MSDERNGIDRGRKSLVDTIIHFCLTNKLVVMLIVAFVVLWGIRVAPFDWEIDWLPRDPVPVDAIPDIGENQQIVFTGWMGRSPQDVEDQVSYPLTVAMLGIPGVKTVRSYSMFGFSTIYVIFKEDVEFYWSRSRVLEKLNSLPSGALPEGVQPMLGPDATALGQVYWYTLEGRDEAGNATGGWEPHELRSIQDWYVRYKLLAADGISEVASVGGYVREYQIDVDPDAMRAHGVALPEVYNAVKMSNLDVGARTIEINKVEYVIRGLGFIASVADIENAVVKVNDNVPIYVKNVATVSLGPALRRGLLDKGGAEAVGGVAVVRYGENPLAAIKSLKAQIARLSPGLPEKIVIDFDRVSPEELRAFAAQHGFAAFEGASLNREAWLTWWKQAPAADRPAWATFSKVTVQSFYDRTGLIYETLGTLNTALGQQILVTIIVILIMVMHLRSSLVIGATLPLAVLICFIAMKVFGVDANVVALSGIAIAIGTIVDMGVIICENILRHLESAEAEESRLTVVYRAASEVGSAVLTAIMTTIVSFLPVFTMIGAEGKLFKPLAFTKTFALFASVIVALTIVPALAHLLFAFKASSRKLLHVCLGGLVVVGLAAAIWWIWWVGAVVIAIAMWHVALPYLPKRVETVMKWAVNYLVAFGVGLILTAYWLPLGPQAGFLANALVVMLPIAALLGFFLLFAKVYAPILRWFLAHKLIFSCLPLLILVAGLYVWLGPGRLLGLGRLNQAPDVQAFGGIETAEAMQKAGLVSLNKAKDGTVREVYWSAQAMSAKPDELRQMLARQGAPDPDHLVDRWRWRHRLHALTRRSWPDMANRSLGEKLRWTLARDWNGLGKEFMPPLDEGSFLYMPTTMPHASIGEVQDVLQKQDMAFAAIPEIESAVGKLGRAETPLDPAPISMIETVINYHPEYLADASGQRPRFRFDPAKVDLFRNAAGEPVRAPDGEPYQVQGAYVRDETTQALIPDDSGMPFRLWRMPLDPALNPGREAWPGIRNPDDIWDAIVEAGEIPGTTSAPKLQPIAARIVMLQSGMRAPMGIKVKGPDLATIEKFGLELEKRLKQVTSIKAEAVIADRIVGKPYLEIDIDREAIARFGVPLNQVQMVIEVAIGGMTTTSTVEGRERYPVRVRYQRELRDSIEALERILVPGMNGQQIPISQLADIRYVRGPQVIKSEDTFLTGYVLFDKLDGYAEVDVVEDAQRFLQQQIDSGELVVPPGVSYEFAGSYENQLRAARTLAVVLPLALFIIFILLYFQFKAIPTTLIVFSGIAVAWAGGFILIWFYGQAWFMQVDLFGVNLRHLFQIDTINLSVAVWVGFLALFGIASDDGVVMGTYLKQSFEANPTDTVEGIREATVEGARRRLRPCLMTTATTLLALLPVLTSTGRGSDIMVPMAIPSFGGMLIELMTMFIVPVLFCWGQELKLRVKRSPA